MLAFCVISAIAEVAVFTWISKEARASTESMQGILWRHLPHAAALILSVIAVSTKNPYLLAASLAVNILAIAYLLIYWRAASRQSSEKG